MTAAAQQAELLRRVRAGDTTAGETLYRATFPAARAYASGFTVHGLDPDDLAAEAYARMLSALAAGKGPATAVTAYLRTTIRNLAWSHLRRRRVIVESPTEHVHELPVVAGEPTAEELLLIAERLDELDHALRALSPRWRRVLLLNAAEGATAQSTGEKMGMTADAVRTLVYRARAALRASMAADLRPAYG